MKIWECSVKVKQVRWKFSNFWKQAYLLWKWSRGWNFIHFQIEVCTSNYCSSLRNEKFLQIKLLKNFSMQPISENCYQTRKTSMSASINRFSVVNDTMKTFAANFVFAKWNSINYFRSKSNTQNCALRVKQSKAIVVILLKKLFQVFFSNQMSQLQIFWIPILKTHFWKPSKTSKNNNFVYQTTK